MTSIKARKAGRWFVWLWLAVVVLTLVGMQAFLFGTKGLPRFMRAWFESNKPADTGP